MTALVLVFAASAAFHILVGAHKLHCVLRAMGVDIRFFETLRVRLGAGPLRAFLPLSAGEIIHLFYFRSRKRMPLADTSGIVVFDKGTNVFGALLWFAVGLSLAPWGSITLAGAVHASWLALVPVAALLVGCAIAIFLVPAHALMVRVASACHPWFGRTVAGLLAPFRQLPPVRKLALVAYGILFQLRPIVVCFFLLRSLGLRPGWVDALAAASAAVCAGYVPGFVAGSGPRETVLVEVLRTGYAPVEALFFAGVLMTLAVNVVPALIGLPWTLWFLRRLRATPAVTEGPP